MDIPFLGTLDLSQPWNLIAALPLLALLFVRSGGFIRLSGAGERGKPLPFTRLRSTLPIFFLGGAIIAAALALAGIEGRYTRKTLLSNLAVRVLIAQDQSGSMFTVADQRFEAFPSIPSPLRCVFADEAAVIAREGIEMLPEPPSGNSPEENIRLRRLWSGAWSLQVLSQYPRIDGSCRAAEALLDELERRTSISGGVRYEVGYGGFGTTSAIYQPITSDYRHARDSITSINWKDASLVLGGATNIHLALYDMLMMALRRHIDAEPGVTAIPGTLANELMADAIQRMGPPEEIDEILARYPGITEQLRRELTDTTIILITDADVIPLWTVLPSFPKMLRIAERFGIPIFVLSTETNNQELRNALPQTGTPERPGEFILLNKLEGYASMSDIMRIILDRTLTRRINKEEISFERKNYAPLAAGIALLLSITSFLMKESVFGRRFTG